MDRRRFDALARLVGNNAMSRRAAASGLAAMAWSSTLAPAAAGAKPRKKKCKPCHVRKHGKCRKAPDDSACNGDGRCRDGTCNPKPTCASTGAVCSQSSQCCSQDCNDIGKSGGSCQAGDAGKPCLTSADCVSQICVGFVCK
ncbi:MAG TPA: hypothetical protein VFQ80_16225 [Thermomicrobiales bacterium]|nr:hypothetical protein [Thermomicrobiales bacterium]